MSKTFTDEDFVTWEAYASSRQFATSPRILFNCLTNRLVRPRYVELPGDEADAEREVHQANEQQLLQLLKQSSELA
jgi:hypothetical protein